MNRERLTLYFSVVLAVALAPVDSIAQLTPVVGYTNTVWAYRPNTNNPNFNPGSAWTDPTFDDSGWFHGRGAFGYESSVGIYPATFNTYIVPPNGVASGSPIFPGQASSPLSAGPTGAGIGAPSTYFRTHFNWVGSTANVTFIMTNLVDDGVIVYLNGTEIMNFNLPATPRPVEWNRGFDGTLGPGLLPGGANPAPFGEPSVFPTNVVPTGLVVGDNVLSVELHQSGNGSSDDVFAMALFAAQPFGPVFANPTQPVDRAVVQNRNYTLNSPANAFPAATYQWFFRQTNTVGYNPLMDATNSGYTITGMSMATEGDYYVVASNSNSSVTSRVAHITFSTDTEKPLVARGIGSGDFMSFVIEFNEGMDPQTAIDPFNYTINTVDAPTTATLLPNGSAVLLQTALQTPNTLYTIGISTLQDLAGNVIDPTNIVIRSWVMTPCGGATFEVYSNLSTTDNSIANTLLRSPFYPDFAQGTYQISVLDTRAAFPDDSHEGYGGRLHGVFIPPISGNWIFYLGSDDSSRLYFNPNGVDPAGKVLIQEETGCCNPWTAHASSPQTLLGGQGYYIETIYKEGVGGDYCKVAARLQSDGPPLDNPNGQIPISAYAISGSQLGSPAMPAEVLAALVPNSPRIQLNGTNVVVTWAPCGTLEVTPSLNLPHTWTSLGSGGSFTTNVGVGLKQFYRIRNP